MAKVYVDALGNTSSYERYLSSQFPGISFTVTAKADSKFRIVGAASIAAKVTRDAWITGWAFEEHESSPQYTWPEERGSGYPSGNGKDLFCALNKTLILTKSCLQIQKRRHGCGMLSNHPSVIHP